ncbi:DUF1870 family protein [Enterococcus hirae]|uniref:Aca2/YdiL-like domain-containing protein n=1 Tax=Enterococcus hirae TaxID=1354 RepID=UPI00136F4478|nr:DUF1870 family protein [Enterococcus hirae]NAE18319.1 DUF1870 family protein [Enterococcus hirae]
MSLEARAVETGNDPFGAPMTGAELRTIREWLALTPEALAADLRVDLRNLRRWENCTAPIPAGVATEVHQLQQEADDAVNRIIERSRASVSPVLTTYHSDEDFHRLDSGTPPRPAAWHRRVTARAAQALPGARIVYATLETEGTTPTESSPR